MRQLFGREPAQVIGALAAAIQLATSLFLPLTVQQQGAVNAVCVALAGVGVAVAVDREKAAPLVTGLLQAIFALGLSFGIALPQALQSTIMTMLAALAAWWLRTQVWAPVPPEATTSFNRHAA